MRNIRNAARQTLSSPNPTGMRRLRMLPVTGLLVATILAATGCCAGYCSHSHPPIGTGVHQERVVSHA